MNRYAGVNWSTTTTVTLMTSNINDPVYIILYTFRVF